MLKNTAYSLVELILVIAIMSALAVVTVPRLQFGAVEHKQAEALAQKMMTDLRRTRSLALREAAADPAGFALVLTGSRPNQHYEIQRVGSGQVIDRHAIADTVTVVGLGGRSLGFGPLGNLLDGSARGLRVTGEGVQTTIQVVAATGRVYATTDPS